MRETIESNCTVAHTISAPPGLTACVLVCILVPLTISSRSLCSYRECVQRVRTESAWCRRVFAGITTQLVTLASITMSVSLQDMLSKSDDPELVEEKQQTPTTAVRMLSPSAKPEDDIKGAVRAKKSSRRSQFFSFRRNAKQASAAKSNPAGGQSVSSASAQSKDSGDAGATGAAKKPRNIRFLSSRKIKITGAGSERGGDEAQLRSSSAILKSVPPQKKPKKRRKKSIFQRSFAHVKRKSSFLKGKNKVIRTRTIAEAQQVQRKLSNLEKSSKRVDAVQLSRELLANLITIFEQGHGALGVKQNLKKAAELRRVAGTEWEDDNAGWEEGNPYRQPESATPNCYCCSAPTASGNRHHCRRCARTVCNGCWGCHAKLWVWYDSSGNLMVARRATASSLAEKPICVGCAHDLMQQRSDSGDPSDDVLLINEAFMGGGPMSFDKGPSSPGRTSSFSVASASRQSVQQERRSSGLKLADADDTVGLIKHCEVCGVLLPLNANWRSQIDLNTQEENESTNIMHKTSITWTVCMSCEHQTRDRDDFAGYQLLITGLHRYTTAMDIQHALDLNLPFMTIECHIIRDSHGSPRLDEDRKAAASLTVARRHQYFQLLEVKRKLKLPQPHDTGEHYEAKIEPMNKMEGFSWKLMARHLHRNYIKEVTATETAGYDDLNEHVFSTDARCMNAIGCRAAAATSRESMYCSVCGGRRGGRGNMLASFILLCFTWPSPCWFRLPNSSL